MDPEKGEIDRKKLDRFIGVATNVGTLIKLWCLLPSGHVISRSSITLVTVNEIAQTSIQQRLKYLNTAIYNKIGEISILNYSFFNEESNNDRVVEK